METIITVAIGGLISLLVWLTMGVFYSKQEIAILKAINVLIKEDIATIRKDIGDISKHITDIKIDLNKK